MVCTVCASNFAVVEMSEALSAQLKPLGIGVTVLCPGFVRTRILESQPNRPERYGPRQTVDPTSPMGARVAQITERVQSGLDPSDVAAQVLTAIREDALYVFPHSRLPWRTELQKRFDSILVAMEKGS
jgi:NAD(P)-dependent dehydrogenase (short-subunit alcohol dehydrogenase family)